MKENKSEEPQETEDKELEDAELEKMCKILRDNIVIYNIMCGEGNYYG